MQALARLFLTLPSLSSVSTRPRDLAIWKRSDHWVCYSKAASDPVLILVLHCWAWPAQHEEPALVLVMLSELHQSMEVLSSQVMKMVLSELPEAWLLVSMVLRQFSSDHWQQVHLLTWTF